MDKPITKDIVKKAIEIIENEVIPVFEFNHNDYDVLERKEIQEALELSIKSLRHFGKREEENRKELWEKLHD